MPARSPRRGTRSARSQTPAKPWLRRAVVAAATTASLAATAPAASSATFTLQEATIEDIQRALDDGTLTCVALTDLYLERIATYEDAGIRLNAITTVNPAVRSEAAALDRVPKGERKDLHCVPTLLKDNVDTFDMPTSNGSVILKDAMAPDDAFITQALVRRGALLLGKAAMGEFAGGSYNTIDGQTTNPYNLKRNTGGSSAGSGAAVAANLAVLAIGTDTSTSVRGPASYNGLAGLRPTTGLISRDGIAPKNLTFDTAGPMARTVTDVTKMLSAVAAPDPSGNDPANDSVWDNLPASLRRKSDPATGRIDYTQFLTGDSLKGMRIGAVRDFFGGDPEIDALAEQAIAVMRARGAEIVDINLDPEFLQTYVIDGGPNIRTPADARFRKDFEDYLATLGPNVPKTVPEFIEIYENEVNHSDKPVEASVMNLLRTSLDRSASDPDFRNLIDNLLPAATEYKLSLFEDHDLDALVFPYDTKFASPISNPVFSIPDPTFVNTKRPNPAIFAGYDSIGFPGVVVPMGFGSQGLPMTISLMGKPYAEGELLGMAYDYEQASRKRAPSPLVPPLAGETIAKPGVPAPPAPPAPPAVPAPAPPAKTPAKRPRTVRVSSRTVRIDGKGRFAVRVTCAKGATDCRVRVRAARSGRTLSRRTITVKAGSATTVRFATTAAIRRSLARGSRVTVRVSVSGSGIKPTKAVSLKIAPRGK